MALLGLWALICELGLRQISPQLTEESARGYLLTAIQKAVEEELDEDPIVFSGLSVGENGVAGISTDGIALTRLKTGVLARLKKSLNGAVTVKVPLGSLLPLRIWNGRGPGVPFQLRLESSADLSFATAFTGAGWNQSCYRLVMTVQAQSFSQSRYFETALQVETSTVLAENVIVGQVPGALLAAANGSE